MTRCSSRGQPARVAVSALLGVLCRRTLTAATVQFFDSTQAATPVTSGDTWDTVRSNGYLITYTRDKLFTGGGPDPIGRVVRVPCPEGVEAQAVTTPPPGVTDYKSRITLKRVDGDVFDLTAFTAKLLANTAGAGGAIEIMPLLNGEDAFNDPLYLNAAGYYGQTFSYDETPNYFGSTAALKGYETYKIGLYVDFALTALSLEGAPIPGPPGDYNADGTVDAADYVAWRKNADTPTGYIPWLAHFGETSGNGTAINSSGIAEPATPVMLVPGTLVRLAEGRKRR